MDSSQNDPPSSSNQLTEDPVQGRSFSTVSTATKRAPRLLLIGAATTILVVLGATMLYLVKSTPSVGPSAGTAATDRLLILDPINSSRPHLAIPDPSITSLHAVEPEENIATWKKYTNQIYDYEIRYPSAWSLISPMEMSSENTGVTEIRRKYDNYRLHNLIITSTKDVRHGKNIDTEAIIRSFLNAPIWKEHPSLEKKTVAGEQSIVVYGVTEEFSKVGMYIWHEDSFVQILWTDTLDREEHPVFDQMISTFAFTEE